jgi:hypothetical protein
MDKKSDGQKTNMFWWLTPRRDEHYQWWWGYQKVRMVVLPESDKQKYLRRQNINET